MGPEGADVEMIERVRENDARNLFFVQPVQDVEARSIAHLAVEQHDIGLQPGDLRDGLAATARRTRLINLGKLRADQLEPAEREWPIFHGTDPYAHGRQTVVWGKSVFGRYALGGRRLIQKKVNKPDN